MIRQLYSLGVLALFALAWLLIVAMTHDLLVGALVRVGVL